ncbi:MAG: DNA gyrase inhibitor YacG [Burkholderiales bacterium]|nr:DNA gyrase inhibitor YacG [Burkholderiales bacterium]
MTPTPEHPPSAAVTVPCPTCGQPSLFAPANRYRPFCSARCKQIDLGAWAAEDFRVPSAAPPDDAEYGDPKRMP